MDLKKIVLTGPESTGKSWLCEKLAEHFHTVYAPEYARLYLEKNGVDYNFEILEKIIHGHLQHQQKYLGQAAGLIFLDTDLINFKIWEEVVFGKTHTFLTKALNTESDHLYLLTYPDIPWESDPLRENPENRGELFELHKAETEKLNRPHRIVKGNKEKRLQNAIAQVEGLIKTDR